MRTIDTAWLAGFLDGEGSFFVNRYRTRWGVVYDPVIQATNTDRRLVDRCRRLCGGSIVTVHVSRRHPTWRDAYCWRVKGRAVGPLAELLVPHLIGKRKQARLVIELRSHMKRGSKPGRWGTRFTPRERRIRERIHVAIQKLNGKAS